MTPQERRLVEELFDKLATLETRPREPDAEQVIMSGLRQAPNATYALVQTVLLQDEALRKADARIQELEGGGTQQQEQGGFLDSMRDTFFGGGQRPRGSVPQTGRDRPMGVPPAYRTENSYQGYQGAGAPPQQAEPSRGGSFLGTAAAAAVGVIGGSMLLNSISGMMGTGQKGNAQTAADLGNNQSNPWGGDASSSDLSKQAGIDGIGKSGEGQRAGLYNDEPQDAPYDTASAEPDDDLGFDFDSDVG